MIFSFCLGVLLMLLNYTISMMLSSPSARKLKLFLEGGRARRPATREWRRKKISIALSWLNFFPAHGKKEPAPGAFPDTGFSS